MRIPVKHIVCILLLATVFSEFARGQETDASDSVGTLLEKGRSLYRQNPASAIGLLLNVRDMAAPERKAEADHLLMRCFERAGSIDTALFYGNEAIVLAKGSGNREREAHYSQRLARTLRSSGESEKALGYYVRALAIYESMPDSGNIAYIENSIGIAHKKQGHYQEAVKHYRRSLNIRRLLGQKNQAAQVTNNLGNVLRYQGELDSALGHYHAALEVFEQLADSGNMSNALNNIGLVHKLNGNRELALDYYRRVQRIRNLLKDERGLNSTLNNIAIIYLGLGKADSALLYFLHTLDYAVKQGIRDAEALARHNIASVHMDEGRWTLAVSGFQESLAVRSELNDIFGMASCNQNLGECYRRMGKYDRAIPYAETALELSTGIGTRIQQKNILKTLYESYAAIGNFRKAYGYQAMQVALNDSIYAEERLAAITEMQAKYESEKRQREIDHVQQQNALQEEKIKRQQSTRNFLFAVIGMSLIIGLILWGRARSLRRMNRELAGQKEDIARNAREKEMLLSEVHHRVKNNLQVISSLLNMQSREVGDKLVLKALREGRDRVHSMALIHQMFYEEHGDTASIELHHYVEELCRSLMRSYGAEEKGIGLELSIDRCLLDVDRATLIGLIINELMTNALKHAFADGRNGTVTVSVSHSTGLCTLRVSDDGSGISGSGRTASFGLKLVESLVKKLKGSVQVRTEGGYSTSIVFPNDEPQ